MRYTLRIAGEHDRDAIVRLAEEAGMGTLATIGHALVADTGMSTDTEPPVDADERHGANNGVIGFVRITQIDGRAYVNPIVVDPKMRVSGVGRSLMQAAREEFGELYLVARGAALPFYRAIGCEPVSWDDIADAIASDCPSCVDLATCGPTPLRYR